MYGLRYRGEYANSIAQELDAMLSAIRAWLSVDHNEDGSHNLRPSGFDFVPIGASVQWHADVAPERWIFAQGQALSRTTYEQLFQLWGTTYGVGDGSTTFNVPNLQRRFPIGYQTAGSVLGTAGGTFDHTHGLNSHTHTLAHTHASLTGSTNSSGGHDHGGSTGAAGDHSHGSSTGSESSHTHTFSTGTGSTQVGEGAVPDTSFASPSHTHSGTTDSGSSHAHSIGGSGDHAHSVSSAGSHDHTLSGATGGASVTDTGAASGSSDAANPPYLVVNFIILAGI